MSAIAAPFGEGGAGCSMPSRTSASRSVDTPRADADAVPDAVPGRRVAAELPREDEAITSSSVCWGVEEWVGHKLLGVLCDQIFMPLVLLARRLRVKGRAYIL
eukprot:CAMPEP_0174717288 /NCGR_PEP_ID=MMETSP1094-20130205/26352_1 /TAXON_ID=156173 /ORGANISM="Chrysochromulina brevifilum, Strain UTEX LB 985" /LENGTH=102 /DNA_ID=CAMNT_0015917201 /DNA_START=369 /DNA_END=676 /DNA_ORIENTATION=-